MEFPDVTKLARAMINRHLDRLPRSRRKGELDKLAAFLNISAEQLRKRRKGTSPWRGDEIMRITAFTGESDYADALEQLIYQQAVQRKLAEGETASEHLLKAVARTTVLVGKHSELLLISLQDGFIDSEEQKRLRAVNAQIIRQARQNNACVDCHVLRASNPAAEC